MILGDHPDFDVADIPDAPLATLPLFLAFGMLVGLIGAAYNSLVAGLQLLAHRLHPIPVVLRAGIIGALVGLALFVDPLTTGGGDAPAQLILAGHHLAPGMIVFYLVIRFAAGPLSCAAGTPGGLFAPPLALGALLGALFSLVVSALAPGTDLTVAFAIVGMSTLFAGVVRAPLTGIALVVEMTAVTSVTVPMLLGVGAALVVTTIVKSPPVYDSLRELMLRGIHRGGR